MSKLSSAVELLADNKLQDVGRVIEELLKLYRANKGIDNRVFLEEHSKLEREIESLLDEYSN